MYFQAIESEIHTIHCYRDHKRIDENECFERVWNTKRNSELKICGEFCRYGSYLKATCPFGKGYRIDSPFHRKPFKLREFNERKPSNGELLRSLRIEKGISQRVLTLFLGDIGVKAVANWETDYRPIPKHAIDKLTKIFKLEEDFFNREEGYESKARHE